MKRKRKFYFSGVALALVIGLVFSSVAVQAATMTCTWNANTEVDLAGYRLFQRLNGGAYDYTSSVAEIPAGTEICTVADLPDGDYRFVLRAFDLTNQESPDSEEVGLLIDDPPGAVTGFG